MRQILFVQERMLKNSLLQRFAHSWAHFGETAMHSISKCASQTLDLKE